MLLNKIQSSIADYKKWLESTRSHPHVHLWESLAIFQQNWDPTDTDPKGMFDRSLQNPETRRLWQTENWYPKRMMLAFWQHEPLMVNAMFEDLFNETREVEWRISRFLFGCDELLRDFKRDHVGSIENNHYHSDFKMVGIYLAFRYPETYAPYDFDIFKKTLEHFQAKDIPQSNDLTRYFKVQRTLMTFLEKDGGVVPAMEKHLNAKRHFMGKTLLLASDFCRFVAEKNG